MIKILFNRNKKLNKEGKGLISFSITLNGNRKYISSEFYVFPKDWDDKKCEVRKSDPNYLKINRRLADGKPTRRGWFFDEVIKFDDLKPKKK